MRRGVLYVGLESKAVEAVLNKVTAGAQLCCPIAAIGAVGRRLFFGREDGPWIPWDPLAIDEHLGCTVKERPWPFCWGDDVWAVGMWDGQPVFLHWELDFFGEAYVGNPLGLSADPSPRTYGQFTSWLQAHVGTTTSLNDGVPAKAAQMLPGSFWRGHPPG